MKVLIYKNNKLTVVNDNKSVFEITAEKPAYLTADEIHYDVFVKTITTNGVTTDMTENEMAVAEAFITSYSFTVAAADITPDNKVYCINTYGDYIGFKVLTANEVAVASMPPQDGKHYFWDGTDWKLAMAVNASGTLAGLGIVATGTQFYIDASLVTTTGLTAAQTYDIATKTIVTNMSVARTTILKYIQRSMFNIYNDNVGILGINEVSSFTTQAAEANAWKADNTSLTPFIDVLLIRRRQNETKEELVNKIIAKSSVYTPVSAGITGDFQYYKKRIEDATDLPSLIVIRDEWDKLVEVA